MFNVPILLSFRVVFPESGGYNIRFVYSCAGRSQCSFFKAGRLDRQSKRSAGVARAVNGVNRKAGFEFCCGLINELNSGRPNGFSQDR
jgi:hypothetical protein